MEKEMIRCMISAPSSGSGKTVVTMALLALLKKLGKNPCAMKCGPDYIDPMFHRAVQEVPCHNLDLFLCGENEETLKGLYHRFQRGYGAVVAEGVMGFYDGLSGTTERASAYAVSEALELPVLLVISPKGSSLTTAAVIRGMKEFRKNRIRAVFLNSCSESLFRSLKPVIREETGLPVIGYLPPIPEAAIGSRHLGLLTAVEIRDLKERIHVLSEELERSLNLSRFEELFTAEEKGHPAEKEFSASLREVPGEDSPDPGEAHGKEGSASKRIRIAVARDEAFCFCYEETLEVLREQGGEPVFFSPIRDREIPKGCGGLLLSGGYPELYASELSENVSMRRSIREAVSSGMPSIAECGGFLYLQKELKGPEGEWYPMAGVFPGQGEKKERLVRFGYAWLEGRRESLLFRPGERVPVHEFHYYDTDCSGEDLTAVKPVTGKSYLAGHCREHLYAGFPHLYLAGMEVLATRFLKKAGTFIC